MAIETEEQFIGVVQKAEKAAEQNIGSYKLRLALFAALGYVVIFTVLFLLLGLVGGMVAITLFSSSILIFLVKKKIIFIVLIAIWTFLKALWIKFEKPEGYELERENFPALFTEIDALAKELNALKIHQVILTGELNAAVVQSPRYGVLGGQRNTLILGLELLLALSPEEMRSVLAHEFGHLSGNHSRFSGWIYRVRASWERVMHAFGDSESFGAGLMRRFFNWYAPYFSAYSFALARSNEYEADSISAELMSPATAIQALVNVHALAPYIDQKYWATYFENTDRMPNPPHNPYEGLAQFLRQTPIEQSELDQRIKDALEVETQYSDTHPSLNDRVKALGGKVVSPQPVESNAAQAWLAEKYHVVLEHFDALWMSENTDRWKERYHYVIEAKKALIEYAGQDINKLDDSALWDYATWTLEFENDEAALPLYRAVQARDKDSVGAAYYIGRILAANEDEEALEHLRIAFNNANTIGDAANWGYNLLLSKERKAEAEQWWNDATSADRVHQEAAAERASATSDDTYSTPVIDDALLDKIKNDLAGVKKIHSVWLAQKEVKHAPDSPVYIIAFKPKGFYFSDEKLTASVAEAMQADSDIFIVSTRGDNKKLAKTIKKIGTKIV